MNPRRISRQHPAFMKAADHRQLWLVVEGAVVDAMRSHPEYFTPQAQKTAVGSITKRVVGQILGRAKGVLRDGGLGPSRAVAVYHRGKESFQATIGDKPADPPSRTGGGNCSPPPTIGREP